MLACLRRVAVAGWVCFLPCIKTLGATAFADGLPPNPVASSPTSEGFELWQAEGGWEQNAVTALVQTHDGYLWLGTYHGLVRYDGVRSTVFDSGNTPELQNGLITSLYETTNGVLWIGHETGHLTRFFASEFRGVRLGQKWPGGVVEAITADEMGDVWLLNDTGLLCRVKDGHTASVPGGASANRKVTVSRAAEGRNWIVANGKAAILEKGAIKPFAFGGDSPGEFYERILPARDGSLWVLSHGRLRHWSEGQWSEPGEPFSKLAGSVTTLLESRSGALLAGTLHDGLYLFNPGTSEPTHFSRANGLPHDWVRCLGEDHEGNLWIGTGAGLNALRTRKIQMLSPPDGWQGCSVLSFTVEPDGSAWIGTEGAGLYRYEGGLWRICNEPCGISNLFVWSVLETRDHRTFAGTWGGGLFVRRNERFESMAGLHNLTAPITALYEGPRGDIWIGTQAGLHRFYAGRITWSAGKDKLVLPDVRAIAEAQDGTIWFGMSGGGLGSLKEGSLRQVLKTNGLGSDFVLCLLPERDGTLWIGTSDNGLARLKDGKFSFINTGQGLPTSIIYHLVDDQAGNIWMGSQAGILRATKADLNRCADGLSGSVPFLNYGKAEGLTARSCSGGFQPGACRTSDGRLWFPTAKGLAIVDPANVRLNSAPPQVHIEELLIDGRPTPMSGAGAGEIPHLEISPGKRTFEFHFTALSFAVPEKVRFKYKLEPMETRWIDAGNSRSLEYSYLRPGAYTFRVIGCNNDGVWNERGAALMLTVQPYFWQTVWFQSVALIGGAGVVGAGVLGATRRRLRQKLEQLERQRSLERERARIARDIHDDLGASLTRISMLSQSVRSESAERPEVAADMDQIYRTARELTRAMDEIVWAVNPRHDTLDSMVTYLGRFAQQFLSTASVRCRLDVPLQLPSWTITSEIRHNVYLALKEILNNIVKHAAATEVRVALELQPDGFTLLMGDNGRGFDLQRTGKTTTSLDLKAEGTRVASGNGLGNIRRRLEEIGGQCEWKTAPGEGTRVKLFVPVSRAMRSIPGRHQNT